MNRNDWVIDADAHVLEPPDLWINYIDPKFRDNAPRLIKTPEGGEKFWYCDDYAMGSGKGNIPAGIMGARDGEIELGANSPPYVEGRPGGFDPHARMPDMDKEGLDAAFLYPTMGLTLDMVRDPTQAAANARAYNRWLADYCSAYPDRLFGVAALPMQSVEAAIEEMRHCAKAYGFRAAFVRPNPNNGRPLHHKDFYPVWRAAQELDIAIAVHGGTGRANLGIDRFPFEEGMAVSHCAVMTFEAMAAAASFIMCGVCEAFPKLRVGFLEAGGGWMLGWLDRMDRHFQDQGMNDTGLEHSPSEIFQRQCFISFEPTEKSLAHVAEPLGLQTLLFATDYPHPDGFWNAVGMIRKMALKPDVERALLCRGAERFYALN